MRLLCRAGIVGARAQARVFSVSAPTWRMGGQKGRPKFRPLDPSFVYPTTPQPQVPSRLDGESLRNAALREMDAWSRSWRIMSRLDLLEVPERESRTLLAAFKKEAFDELQSAMTCKHWNLDATASNYSTDHIAAVDRALTHNFLRWLANPDKGPITDSNQIVERVSKILEECDMSHPAEWFDARKFRRKLILHVGPTNSGKTFNALRALAGAKTGFYAGPLRLLAHEIWERLNKGLIPPLGADPASDPEKCRRACNLITGEEQRIVEDDCGLTSYTVEMLNFTSHVEVAVVDEIQMIADPDRGASWTSAVLGLNADELHLCGEESAVPVIEALARETGDEVIINRYQRLSPLQVANYSLDSDLSKIQKGDAVIAFSRSNIFLLKKMIEEKVGLRCALAYGRLPPEVRSEQAALFNDPTSGYDVMVASDAIGMGLNLKIRRVVFSAVHKFNGEEDIPLTVSQAKQIGGRAGRYDASRSENIGGIVTSLHQKDLPLLQKLMSSEVKPLNHARVPVIHKQMFPVSRQLRQSAPLGQLFELLPLISSYPSYYQFGSMRNEFGTIEAIDQYVPELSLAEKVPLLLAPAPLSDPLCLEAMKRFLRMYRKDFQVEFKHALRETGMLEALDDVRGLMAENKPPVSSPETLKLLESLHKIATMYLWLSIRLPLSFHQGREIRDLKEDTELSIQYCLAGLSEAELRKDTERRSTTSGAQLSQDSVPRGASFGLRRDSQDDKIRFTRPETRSRVPRTGAVSSSRRLRPLARSVDL